MDQGSLFHEDVYEALRTDIMASGGFKAVGSLLKPESEVTAAGRWLNDCLNGAKSDKLSPEQMMLIIRSAKSHGSYAAMWFMTDQCGFNRPNPVEPEDERAKLMREYIEATKRLGSIAAQIEKRF